MKKYLKIIEELKQKNIVAANEIFDYEYSPLKAVYNNYFEYCQEYLTTYCQNYSIQPARIYFCNNFSVNAKATLKNRYYVICINMGTIQTTYELFYENNAVFEENPILLNMFTELSNLIHVPTGYLMFQLSTLFTFHHELAHLVQFSPTFDKEFTEQYASQQNKEFDFENHVLEYDSDIHGASAICSQLLEHFKKLSSENQTKKNLTLLLAIGIASIFSYFLLYFSDNKKIYYKEFSHPHPLIRISYVLDCIIEVAKENLPISVKINKEKLVELGFRISDLFYKSQSDFSHVVGEFKKHFLDKFDGIENYANEIVEYSLKMKNLLINRV